ncbi:hypothetical protein HJ588_13055 [Flexivirga sp. ID2601S]|uniref:Uncharacterized protein n=1 Tax=Flexivirga aerilata TaxID=1656889 RepID=A0A849AH72_9MICO|nr:hypothetical protein [Flexivirga aerilata]NNG40194.1 hypothetical protein [Flexivirga aerilata]
MASSRARQVLSVYAVPGRLTVGASHQVRAAGVGVRSHLADGRGVVWDPALPQGFSAAIDAEILLQSVTPRLARRVGSDDPAIVWPRWTRCEVAAKLLDLPVLSWLAWDRLQLPADVAARIDTAHVRVGDVLVCCGVRGPEG